MLSTHINTDIYAWSIRLSPKNQQFAKYSIKYILVLFVLSIWTEAKYSLCKKKKKKKKNLLFLILIKNIQTRKKVKQWSLKTKSGTLGLR